MISAVTATPDYATAANAASNTSSNTSAADSTTGSSSKTSATSGTDAMGKDMFLKLLVAQLKYQDPMKPTDGTEFVTQTSQLSMVEKLEDILSATVANAVSSASLAATGLVGRTIEYADANGAKLTGLVSAVRLDRAGPVLVVGRDEVPLGSIVQVLVTPASPSTTNANPTATATPTSTPTATPNPTPTATTTPSTPTAATPTATPNPA